MLSVCFACFCLSIKQVLSQNCSKKDEFYLHKNELAIKAIFRLRILPQDLFWNRMETKTRKWHLGLILAYGWRVQNLDWPIRIQQAGKALLSWRQCKFTGKALKSGNSILGILKSTIKNGQSNFSFVFIFVSCEEKGYYPVVSVEQFSFDCCSYSSAVRTFPTFWNLQDENSASLKLFSLFNF